MSEYKFIPEVSIDAGLAILKKVYRGYCVKIEINPHEDFPFFIRIEGHGSVTGINWPVAFDGAIDLVKYRSTKETPNTDGLQTKERKCEVCGETKTSLLNFVGFHPTIIVCTFCLPKRFGDVDEFRKRHVRDCIRPVVDIPEEG